MATSIESKLSLALALKLKAIFEKPDRMDKFLTFPYGIGFTYDYLSFMRSPGESNLSAIDQQNIKCDFARTLNCSFSDSPQYSPDASVFLWEKFENILKNSSFPQSTLSDQEEKQLSEATQFLTTVKTDETGVAVSVPSAAYNEYIKYKTTYDKTTNVYLDEKISVENSTGPDSEKRKKDWQDFREKQLQDAISKANDDWLNLGHKLQIENYQAIKNALEQKKFVNLVREAYLNDLELSDVPDLNAGGLSTKITFFSPFDIADKSIPWISVHLTKSEIDNLAQQASAELKAIFNPEEGSGDIESASLEYNTVAIIRPWAAFEYFSSRYWNLLDGSIVSDGNVPCHGEIPAYISSMIVARNITITRTKERSGKPPSEPIIPILSAVSIKNSAPVLLHEQKFKRNMVLRTDRIEEASVDKVKSNVVMAPDTSKVMPSSRRFVPMQMNVKSVALTEPVLARETTAKKVVSAQSYSNFKYKAITMETPPIISPPPPPQRDDAPPSSQSTDLISETYPFDGVFVLAYMCKRVPKSPNPDPTLEWS